MTDNERNHHVGELAERFFAFKWPKASRRLRELDEGTQRSCYGLAGIAMAYFEEALAQSGVTDGPNCGRVERLAGVALEAVPPSRGVEGATRNSSEPAVEESRLESGRQPSEDDEPDLRVEDVLAEPDDEIDSNIPF